MKKHVKSTDKNSFLVLSRRVDEKIYVGDDIEIVICAIRPDQVRVGIKAPKNVSIFRDDCKNMTNNVR